MGINKLKEFEDLCLCIQKCNKCKDMEKRTRVFSSKNGDINAKILFIAEAPGRLGADKTGIPLYGDMTGRNFSMLLGITPSEEKGWEKTGIFITNAVLCNPRTKDGRNKKPSSYNKEQCKIYLEQTIKVINPKIIVCLGSVAARILGIKFNNMKEIVGKKLVLNDRKIYVLYHPSPLSFTHRSSKEQKNDWKIIKSLLK